MSRVSEFELAKLAQLEELDNKIAQLEDRHKELLVKYAEDDSEEANQKIANIEDQIERTNYERERCEDSTIQDEEKDAGFELAKARRAFRQGRDD